jgi:hypothetical protein
MQVADHLAAIEPATDETAITNPQQTKPLLTNPQQTNPTKTIHCRTGKKAAGDETVPRQQNEVKRGQMKGVNKHG